MDKYTQTVQLWRSWQIASAAGLDKYLDSFRILFAFHSGKIENEEITYHDTREIFENSKVSNYTGNPRTLFEQQNQKFCYEYLKKKIVQKDPLSLELIKEIHRILAAGTYDERRFIENGERPGEFKKHDYVTGIHEVGSSAKAVESDLTELLNKVNAQAGEDIMKTAAYLHARFEDIHPFADGNGRVGRTLTNYFLMIANHPPFILYDEDKRRYYECLLKYDESGETNSLYEFFKYETEKTWAKTLTLAQGK